MEEYVRYCNDWKASNKFTVEQTRDSPHAEFTQTVNIYFIKLIIANFLAGEQFNTLFKFDKSTLGYKD